MFINITTALLKKERILYEIPEEIQDQNDKENKTVATMYFKLKDIEGQIESFKENAIFKYDTAINSLRKLQKLNQEKAKKIKKDLIKKIVLKDIESQRNQVKPKQEQLKENINEVMSQIKEYVKKLNINLNKK